MAPRVQRALASVAGQEEGNMPGEGEGEGSGSYCSWSEGGGTGSFTEGTVQGPRREGTVEITTTWLVVVRTAIIHWFTYHGNGS